MTTDTEPHGVLVVDKARGPTSHDVVAVARRVLGTRAVGHTGTLDPMATGVLVIGEATKLVNSLSALQKRYEATVRLGLSTTTLDAEGEVDGHAELPTLTRAEVEVEAARFLGEHPQRAPAVSAIKVGGKSLHKRARAGQKVDAPVRRVRLDAIEVQAVRGAEIELALTCGAGFYVRSLARDLAERLGTLGHLAALRRTHNGRYALDQAVAFEQLLRARAEPGARADVREHVLDFAQVCRGLPHVVLDAEGVRHARHGRAIPRVHVCPPDAGADGVATSGHDDAQRRWPESEAAAAVDEHKRAGALIAFDDAGVAVALLEPLLDHFRVLRGFRSL